MKTKKSNSWVVHIKKILAKYSLPSIFELLSNPVPRSVWKKSVKSAIDVKRTEEIESEAKNKSTLHYLNTSYSLNKLHPCIADLVNVREVRRTQLFARVLTGTYTLQTTKVKACVAYYVRKRIKTLLTSSCPAPPWH